MMDTQGGEWLREALPRLSRFPLAQLPTPLEDAPRLSDRLGVRTLVKRDDQTGLALGGNKARKLEFLIAHALEVGADTVLTTGGSQSNHARMTAAACRRAELGCYLVLDRGVHPEPQGNMLLDELLGARVRLLDSQDPAVATAEMERLAEELRRQGKSPYIIPRGGSVPQGAVGYAAFVLELMDQVQERGISPTYLYLGTGSTGTHSGVLAGLIAAQWDLAVQGISVGRGEAEQRDKVMALTRATLEFLGVPSSVEESRVRVDGRFRGPGYGIPTPQTMEAIEIAALDEGLILDPVYTGKAMAGLVGHAREGRFGGDDLVIFLHTGGSPALFAYNREVAGSLAAASP